LSILNVRHTTVYRYRRPVALGDHRLMLRPRDSHDLRLIQTNLNLSPPATLRWSHDVFGNSIAIASFAEPSAELRIESSLQLETYVVERPAFQITPEAVSYPFIYSADDRLDLGRMLERHHPDPADRLGSWARGFIRSNPTNTSALLADLNSGVAAWISYQNRETEGTQTPIETLNRGWGSCRDLAVLLIEAAPQPWLWGTRRDGISLQSFGGRSHHGGNRRWDDTRMG
jgi:transglutaminase-like putative cysteine protease